jgi:hypothetical protein
MGYPDSTTAESVRGSLNRDVPQKGSTTANITMARSRPKKKSVCWSAQLKLDQAALGQIYEIVETDETVCEWLPLYLLVRHPQNESYSEPPVY